eukprot:UN06044
MKETQSLFRSTRIQLENLTKNNEYVRKERNELSTQVGNLKDSLSDCSSELRNYKSEIGVLQQQNGGLRDALSESIFERSQHGQYKFDNIHEVIKANLEKDKQIQQMQQMQTDQDKAFEDKLQLMLKRTKMLLQNITELYR